jgi:hypothetical protein
LEQNRIIVKTMAEQIRFIFAPSFFCALLICRPLQAVTAENVEKFGPGRKKIQFLD